MSFKLKRFDPKNLGDDKVIVVIGKRNTGKSTLLTDILWHKKHLPVGVIMSATEDGNHHYKKFLPDTFVYGDFYPDVMNNVIKRQKKLVSTGKNGESAKTFILLDDCMYNKSFFKETCIRQVFMNGRHWKIFFLMTMQYCMDLSPDLRANVDYVFILRENIRANRERLWKAFAGIFPKYDMFSQVMDVCTENYECLVIDNTSKSNSIEDCVFWYKARVRKGFHIGSPKIWEIHKRMYDKSHSPPDPDDRPPQPSKNRIKVSKVMV